MLFIFSPSLALSSEIQKVYWATEVWEGYTDEHGVYTQLMNKIFTSEGITLDMKIYPFKRALRLVVIGEADIAGGIPKDTQPNSDYIQAKYPIAVSRFNAFYHKDNIKKWNNIDSIKNKRIISTPHVGSNVGLKESEYHVVADRKQALKLVLNKRFEVYIDDEKVLNTTLNKFQELFNRSDYKVSPLFISRWYLITTNTVRGRKIMDIFEAGMLKLAKSGELKELYESHGFYVPEVE